MTGELPEKGPVTQEMFPLDEVSMVGVSLLSSKYFPPACSALEINVSATNSFAIFAFAMDLYNVVQ